MFNNGNKSTPVFNSQNSIGTDPGHKPQRNETHKLSEVIKPQNYKNAQMLKKTKPNIHRNEYYVTYDMHKTLYYDANI